MNKARQLVCAIFNYGMRPSTYALANNPAQHAARRREPHAATLAFYSCEQIEALAQALSAGAHRDPDRPAVGDEEAAARASDDGQDAELVRVAAYAGLRRGELVALRWRDVDFVGQKLIVRRALSGETDVRSTKSRRAREVPSPVRPPVRSSGFGGAANSPARSAGCVLVPARMAGLNAGARVAPLTNEVITTMGRDADKSQPDEGRGTPRGKQAQRAPGGQSTIRREHRPPGRPGPA